LKYQFYNNSYLCSDPITIHISINQLIGKKTKITLELLKHNVYTDIETLASSKTFSA